MRSNMTHSFSNIPRADINRSTFFTPEVYKTTMDAGWLVPFYTDEVVPGDTFNIKTQVFGRLATPLHPIMDNLHLETFFFFVPNRLIWDNWQAFMGEQDDPMDPVEYIVPEINSGDGFAELSLADYFGIPTKVPNLPVNSLHFRAYNLIYNEWFRDENLIEPVEVPTGDSDSASNYTLLKRGKRHDYFTSCLPWPQKGPGVNVPIGGFAPVIGNGMSLGLSDYFSPGPWAHALAVDNSLIGGSVLRLSADGINKTLPYADAGGFDNGRQNRVLGVSSDPDSSGLIADLSEATAYTINELRTAMQLQKMLERDARGGTRYTEIIRAHFGVISPDMRLQRPEYLGGASNRIDTFPVQQTSASTGHVGDLGAFGLGTSRSGFNKSFVEHGVIIGLMSIRADLTYQQGLHRMWSRHTKYDYLWPALSNIGEQAVYNKEIFAQSNSVLDSQGNPQNDGIFGYQERYAEYRYGKSHITGLFRSNAAASLHSWHLSQAFPSLPSLDEDFITDNTDVVLDRCIAVPSQPQFIMDVYTEGRKSRPLPVFGVPGLMDHF